MVELSPGPNQKSVLVLSGEGPYFKNSTYYDGTMFDAHATRPLAPEYVGHPLGELRLTDLVCSDGSRWQPLLRPKRGSVPHLTSYTLESILLAADRRFELMDLGHVWDADGEPAARHPVVFLSTTFICDKGTLRRALTWIRERCQGALVVLGGQYSNLKFDSILRTHPEVDLVVRGDGEQAIPLLLDALDRGDPLDQVPNLVIRTGPTTYRLTGFGYIDLEEHPSPGFGTGHRPVVPYESMRGCPFSCKFCSFPFASPEWRYKSAEKIASDWARYREVNEARHIRAMDSTFTVPPTRMRRLMELLPSVNVTWEAYTRANVITGRETVERLAEAHCATLSIGFESMSPKSLDLMHKQVRAEQNRRAHEALSGGPVRYRTSFMVGYPGEAPQDYELTHRFLLGEYTGHFMLSVFSMTDETMPVWQDAERLRIEVEDFEDPDAAWTHIGMDHVTAKQLRKRTLDEVRLRNDDAVLLLWQSDYHTPLLPKESAKTNLWAEKLVERLGMLPVDVPDVRRRVEAAADLLGSLESLGVRVNTSAPSRTQEPAL
ncbi:anaerobic magnesium-protoporphyrin IX monomethyl ester cyclase [Kitasatospora sp. MAP12-15]|uniref:B12-binding domain-containing radical SAM protein n=1 Tax=unclassified Kitasatospora TaxID=2633591 RepID=UPI0024765484|nr:radical SAM protein [Kitasatospora sp. MAP12-44]MDH6108197.1 anaerobic magnesium-protoporphyrin IX monomethyl ester cyclase [Kitasatospora sp. MAP12-44]